MGIKGAALATGSGQVLTLTVYLVVYLARPIRVHIRRQYMLPSKKMVIKLYSIGIPATPVSYTHLDVSKRQASALSAADSALF